MLLKQQFFTTSGVNQGHDRSFQYAYRRHHPLLQFLPIKLAEWVARNLSDELNLPDMPDADDTLESAVLNRILTECIVSNRSGNNLHTYQCVEFESDLYRGVMRARCYPFNMDNHRFHDKIVKDCVATIPPYPHYIGERGDGYDVASAISDPDSLWIVRPQLFFKCTLRPINAAKGRYNCYPDDIDLDLVFFSAFEDLGLHTSGTMEANGIRKLYEPSPIPTLYIGRTEDLLGRVPLFPCFLDGNATSTIPYKYAPRQKQAFEFGCADGASQGSRRGSHVYEINTWLWNFGRPQPRIGGLSVIKTEDIRRRSRSETSRRAWKTRQARKRAADEEEST